MKSTLKKMEGICRMMLDCAPLEGVTNYIYRNAHHACFPGVDRYFAPFLQPNSGHKFTGRDLSDVRPENNRGICLVPQLLTCVSEDFVWAAYDLQQMGYTQVNLNLGCPSGTVATKGKGSGFLKTPDKLDRFLDEIFSAVQLKISIKTRLGDATENEFDRLMQIFRRYPVQELIIHPRVRTDMYKNAPHIAAFQKAYETSRAPVGYNGNLFSTQDFARFSAMFPDASSAMFGRGLMANPALIEQIRKGGEPACIGNTRLREFHGQLYEGYRGILSGERNVLFKMKEVWFYLSGLYPEAEKELKKIRKAQRLADYETAVNILWETHAPRAQAAWLTTFGEPFEWPQKR